MRIETIEVEGLWSYTEPQTIDITGLPLIIGVGVTGAGKSALLVSAVVAALYGRFPTKTVDESISTGSASGRVKLQFTVAGNRYQVERTHPRVGAATASLNVEDGNSPTGWRPVTEKGPREVSAQIVELIGMTYTTATMTWIAEQGQYGKFAAAQPVDRFNLLADVLGLEQYATKAKIAKTKLDESQSKVERLDGRITEISDSLIDKDATPETEGLRALTDTDLDAQVAAAAAEVDRLVNELAHLEANDPKSRLTAARQALQLAQSTRVHALTQAQEAATRANSNGVAARQRGTTERETADNRLNQATDVANSRFAQATQRIETTRQGAQAAVDAVDAVEGRIPGVQNIIADREQQEQFAVNTVGAHLTELNELESANAALRVEFGGVAQQVGEARERIGALTRTANSDHTSCFSCGQHLSPADAQALITSQQGDIARWEARQAEINTAGQANKTRIAEVTASKAVAERAVTDARDSVRSAYNELARLTEMVATKQSHLDTLNSVDSDLANEKAAQQAAFDAANRDHQTSVDAANTAEQNAVDEATVQLTAANTVIAENAAPSDEESALVTAAEQAEATASADAPAYEQKCVAVTGERDTARALAGDLGREQARRHEAAALRTEREGRMKTAVAELAEARNQVAVNTSLHKAYSPAGIPAMILGGITAELNDSINSALKRLSRDEMSIELRTSRETAKGGVENKVTVYVATSDGLRSYETLSGGQKFRVDLAIRTGLTQVVSRGTGTPVETFILDEGWGSQDEAGLLSMFDTLNRLSESTNVITVSHIDTVKDAFATQVEVTRNEGSSHAVVVQ